LNIFFGGIEMKKLSKIIAIAVSLMLIVAMVAACADEEPAAADDEGIRVALVAHGPESIQFDGSLMKAHGGASLSFLKVKDLIQPQMQTFSKHMLLRMTHALTL